MPKLSLGLGVQNLRKVGGGTIFRILISGAGTASANNEYIWEGDLLDGRRKYVAEFSIQFDGGWKIYDSGNDENLYASEDLVTWTVANGASPAPTSTLYYTP